MNRGSFAIVRSAINKKTGEKVAIKIIDRYKLLMAYLKFETHWEMKSL